MGIGEIRDGGNVGMHAGRIKVYTSSKMTGREGEVSKDACSGMHRK
jgi:hypothetical protein